MESLIMTCIAFSFLFFILGKAGGALIYILSEIWPFLLIGIIALAVKTSHDMDEKK